jgi:predicted DNA-binding transcriptional regulator YafY
MRDKSLIDIHILEILQQYASDKKRMTQKRLIGLLEQNYGICVSRRTLSGYLQELREEGYIGGTRGVYKINLFSDTELRLLIDGVLFGKHVPEEEAEQLIQKIKGLSQVSLKNRIKHVHYLKTIQHTDNTQLYSILDILDEAIEKKKKVKITQCSYGIDGKLTDWGNAIVSPYYIVTSKSMYYLVCFAGRNDDLENRRIDRISKVTLLDENRVPLEQLNKYKQCPFNLSDYMRTHIYMFSGECCKITLRVKKRAIGDVIDWYGKDYRVVQEDDEHVVIKLDANCNAVYYWALQYGSVVEVLAPERLRQRIREGVMEMVEKYDEEVKYH